MPTRDNRVISVLNSQFNTRAEDNNKYIEGYFAVFNQKYDLWEDAYEMIDPQAFGDLTGEDVRALINHDTTLVLGRTKVNTLSLKVDDHGLWGSVLINEEDQDAMNIYARVQRGDVSQCSFGFHITDEEIIRNGGETCFLIKGVKLYEVSVCTFPAYETTHVQARQKELEEINSNRLAAWKGTMLAKLRKE